MHAPVTTPVLAGAAAQAAFRQFVHREQLTGGPDHHRVLAVEGAQRAADPVVRLWRVLCYVATYEIHTGAQIWTAWPLPQRVLAAGEAFATWVGSEWPRFLWRRERRAARSIPKLTDALRSCAAFALKYGRSGDSAYEVWWARALAELRYFGRYATIKVLETWRRAGGPVGPCPDIRPVDGWSPRAALAELVPVVADVCLRGGNSAGALSAVHWAATQIRDAILPDASWETVEILLCNYHVAAHTRGEYPGRRLDTDLGHYYAAQAHWDNRAPDDLPFLEWRERRFPAACLGEVRGWRGRRPELGACWLDHGYFWCDMLYDYYASRERLADPVAWS